MKLTGTVQEFINAGFIPSDAPIASFKDSLVEIMPSTSDLEKLVSTLNSRNGDVRTSEYANLAYALDVNSEITCIGKNLFCVEAELIPDEFLTVEPVDETKIDLEKILNSVLYGDSEENLKSDELDQLDQLFEIPNLPPIFFIAKA